MQVARAFSFIGIAAIGATVVIVGGGSTCVGSLIGLTDVVVALALAPGGGSPDRRWRGWRWRLMRRGQWCAGAYTDCRVHCHPRHALDGARAAISSPAAG